MKLSNSIKGDLSGGVATALTSIPQVIGYGLLVFAPFGKDYLVFGVLAGLYGAIITSIIASLFGSSRAQITGPNAPLSLLMLGVLTVLAHTFPGDFSLAHALFLIGWLSITVILAGLLQIIFSALKFGQLIKYTPYPVVVGFLTGAGLLLIVKQFEVFMGTYHVSHELIFFKRLVFAEPFTILIGFVTIATIYISKRLTSKIPPVLPGIIVGTGLYYAIKAMLPSAKLSPVIDHIAATTPQLTLWHSFVSQFSLTADAKIVPYILLSALIIALIATLITLLSALSVDLKLDMRHDSNHELMGQGIANICSGLSGNLVAAGSAPRSFVNIHAGGRNRLSSIVCGAIILLTILFAKPLIEILPEAVIAAVIIQVGISMIDIGLFEKKWRIIKQVKYKAEYIVDLSIILLVTLLTVTVNLTAAILIGIIIAIGFYIYKMGKLTFRREGNALERHSKKMRPEKYTQLLRKVGEKIGIIELQGSLFFGSAETLASHIETMMTTEECFIIDFKRVIDIDSTGVMALQRLTNRLGHRNKQILFSYVSQNERIYLHMLHSGFIQQVGEQHFFMDTDRALEYAEDALLIKELGSVEHEQYSLEQVQIFKKLSSQQLTVIKEYCKLKEYTPKQTVFEINDASRDLYILIKGSITLERIEEDGSTMRLLTIKPGVIFGEMSFLINVPRSASATADTHATLYTLAHADFKQLHQSHPEIALKILEYISSELVVRLASTSEQLACLEHE